jgi:hypothetical protein
MKSLIVLVSLMVGSLAFANDPFINLAKKTFSVYSGNSDVDASNSATLGFETLIDNQRVYLNLGATKLNSTFFTLVNSEAALKSAVRSTSPIHVYNLQIKLNPSVAATAACDGSDVIAADTSCTGKKCSVTQRVISQCNADDCWVNNPTTDRSLTAMISEPFQMKAKVEVSACVANNVAGVKHVLEFSVANESASSLRGGSLNYSLMVQNDVIPVN